MRIVIMLMKIAKQNNNALGSVCSSVRQYGLSQLNSFGTKIIISSPRFIVPTWAMAVYLDD